EEIPYVDNAACFEGFFANGTPESELLADDMAHANAKGYTLIAQNILAVMQQHRLLGLDAENNGEDTK
ncbi:hypothetical protein, partial [Oscillibacter sp.]|uniref:hypothetical protein n=1 Tax=Oscillibacter sp. TaxID=1945593 RepID=UPI00260FFFA8